MKTSVLLAVVALCFVCLFNNCKKSPVVVDQLALLPPVTNTGANTFGCLINGMAMTPKAGTPTFGNPVGPPLYVEFRSQVRVNAGSSATNSPAANIGLYLYNIYATGVTNYDWAKKDWTTTFPEYNSQIFGQFLNEKTKLYYWYGSYNNSGTTIISKFDTTNHILSGIFSGKLTHRFEIDGTDTVNITNGRFDLKW